jgi:hypothetical protein
VWEEVTEKKKRVPSIISLRTRLLLCAATLAPAARLLIHLDVEASGGWAWTFEIGWLPKLMVIVGMNSFVAAIASFVVDLPRAR